MDNFLYHSYRLLVGETIRSLVEQLKLIGLLSGVLLDEQIKAEKIAIATDGEVP